KLVIQRMRSCSSGVARGRRAFARPRAAESGILPREASESAAYPRANCGSFCMARRALTSAPSTMWFSYLSRESSTNLRASCERVETGILPKSCCLELAAILEEELVLRALATSTRGAESCAQAGQPNNEGKIRRRTRTEKRF